MRKTKVKNTEKPAFVGQKHPWHDVDVYRERPNVVNVYLEMVPRDTLKFEVDKETGLMRIDRPQRYSSQVPAAYGFIPRTYCGKLSADYCARRCGKNKLQGDGDPLDICVLSEREIPRGGILVDAVPIGGFRMIDRGEADDKIIAVLANDGAYGDWHDLSDCPRDLLERLKHYFLTYKDIPSRSSKKKVEIAAVCDAKEARRIIELAAEDYQLEIKA